MSPARPREVTLQEALLLAQSNNKLLEAARIRVEEARGDLTTASILLIDNPEVGLVAGPRRSDVPGAEDSTDVGVGLEQRFEIAGQRRHRIRKSEANLAAAGAAAAEVGRVVELAAATAFWQALAADRYVSLLEDSRSLASDLYETSRLRLEHGEATPLALNTARVRLAEAERRLASAKAQRTSAALRLAEVMALPLSDALVVKGSFPEARATESEEALVARALATRPDLSTRDHQVVAAEEDAGLASAEAWPDLTLGVSYEEEEDDRITLAGLTIPLPLFRRNQGERQRTQAVVRRLNAERDAVRLAIESEVRRTHADYQQARQSVHLYDTEVLQALEESLGLLQKALEAGEVGLPEVILVQREVLDGREGYLSAKLDLALAHARLQAATQQSQTNTEQE